MDMYDSLFSSNSVLNEQIACQLFEVLPDQGPIMVIMNSTAGRAVQRNFPS
jgi:hypothetical protein